MSPQITNRTGSYSPISSDIFAAAVCLFAMVCGYMPFKQATKDDPYYKCIIKNRLDIFWRSHDKKMQDKGRKVISKELKELLG